ncbi:hydrolase [Pullulanibacillus camelliae]|uniref:Hydrolase n=1 Tax=Pullulanibacillus camelliae TaxID=1707096 RepID=A0A8J2VJU6_9BACL|nr:alpha/beta hydrolase [Pullulanibacillus camelliae]GGE28690.1 hydrolase [Pullulanibacillus camelliae]
MANCQLQDGTILYFEHYGEGKVPLIFLHPPLMGHVVFKYQRQLAKDFRVIFYDMRGHGRSICQETEGDPLEVNRLDLLALIDHLRLEKVILVGYSAAGMLAMHFALKYPQRVAALVLSGGFPKVETWSLKQQFNIGIGLMAADRVSFLSRMLAYSHKQQFVDFQELYNYGKMANAMIVQRMYACYRDYDCTEHLYKLANLPTLVLYGQLSRHIRYHHHLFQDYLPRAEIAYINRAFHELPTKKYSIFNQIVEHFLKRCGYCG